MSGGGTSFRIGVDIGGTFTDIVLLSEDGILFSKKLLSTPHDFSEAIEQGVLALLAETGVTASQIVEFFHGTTVATNAIIERRGVAVALVTTEGFRDILELGRFRVPRLYDLDFRKLEPLVERRLRFEVPERVSGTGEIIKSVDLTALDRIAAAIEAEGVPAVAVCFVNSYVNPDNEFTALRHLVERLSGVSISASVQLLPQIQEYERTSTTVINAYIRPVVSNYLNSLKQRLTAMRITAPILLMQSSGGVIPGALAAENPVTIIESGPAAGVVGAQRLGERLGMPDLMVLDMGGTTAKASAIEDGRYVVTTETEVGGGARLGPRLIQGSGYTVQVPTIDIAEVGAGGGSIASVDEAGGMQVGPRSAGAVPGPVCYDRSGSQPTVTDANLVLGYLSPDALVGGDLPLNRAKAEAAIGTLGARLGLSLTDTAYGIHLIANSNMMRALNGVSSERGRDPSNYKLLAIGGNGAVHAATLAEDLRIATIVVPPIAGVFSALGMLFADVEHQLIRAHYRLLGALDLAETTLLLRSMVAEGAALLAEEGYPPERQEFRIIAETKYVGQMSTLPLEVPALPVTEEVVARMGEAFAGAHEQAYGYASPHEKVQIVAVKVLARGISPAPRVPAAIVPDREMLRSEDARLAYFGTQDGSILTPVLARSGLQETPRAGPLIIEEYDSTTVVRPGWTARRDAANNIILERT